MAGIADPENGTLKALLEASSLRILSVSTGSGDAVGLTGTDVRTVGRMDAEITDPSGDSAISAQRLEGTATLSSFSDANRNPDGSPILSNTIVFNVDGFKQTENVTTPGDIDFGVSATR